MEATWRWAPITAIAPIAWGTTYYVTHAYLPATHPLYGAVLRALPAGLLLLLLTRRLPAGSWWWRSLVLGTLNMSVFFALIYLAAQLLPSSVASTIMATSPMVMMLLAWGLVAERPAVTHLAGAAVGVAGVALTVFTGAEAVNGWGVLASVAAMILSSAGFILAKRWSRGVDVLASTAWQLTAGGLVLLPFAVVVEGAPPPVTGSGVAAYAYVSVVATAVAFAAWFTGLRHLPAGTVGLIGLLNPVTGVVVGTLVAAETLTPIQLGGLALTFAGILLGRPVTPRRPPVAAGSARRSEPDRAAGIR
ncbi:EamA family transporter [Herbidospora galbida]|uniref:EamA family transporter n=1 Tax=Herbidospora galbida TaxID=2575442 RepID=A0A4U3M6Z9_9ACTN|nr:EamA family transporter [Herbidospora galbida]TKK83744.1 EamA family transporter [Herbidospora galbida]